LRAGTLSNRKVRRLLKDRFVCAWVNTEGDKSAGASFAHEPGEAAPSCIRGNGEHNVQMVFLTPQGEIFNVVAGYITADDFAEELAFAQKTYEKVVSASGPEQQEAAVVSAHKKMAKKLKEKKFDGPLGQFARRRALKDHEFMTKHPLIHVDAFTPEMLVGNATTFFGGYNGKKPSGSIGDSEALDRMKKRMKELLPDDDEEEEETTPSERN
jgi:hypothetical protein